MVLENALFDYRYLRNTYYRNNNTLRGFQHIQSDWSNLFSGREMNCFSSDLKSPINKEHLTVIGKIEKFIIKFDLQIFLRKYYNVYLRVYTFSYRN